MLTTITTYISQNPEHALIIAFALAFIESIPIIGHFFPGFIIMPPIGVLIAKQLLPWQPAAAAITLGGFLGDWSGYLIGKHCGERVKKQTKLIQQYQQRSQQLLADYGVFAVIIGRFSGPMRSLAPMLMGLLKLPQGTFIVACIPAVILWTGVHLLPGLLFAWIPITTAITIVRTQLIYAVCTCAPLLLQIKPHRQTKLTTLSSCYNIMLSSTSLISLLAWLYYGDFSEINFYLYSQFDHLRSASWLQLALVPTALGDVSWLLVLSACCCVFHYLKQQQSFALQLAYCIGTSFILTYLLKISLAYPRPEQVQALLGVGSMPSGHTSLSTALGLLYIQYGYSFIITHLLILICATSRILLGAHWCSDVIAGYIIGYIAYQASQLAHKSSHKRSVTTHSGLTLIFLSYILLNLSSNYFFNHLNPRAYIRTHTSTTRTANVN